MPANTFGTFFRITSWGESHGQAIGCVIDGVPAGIAVDEALLQRDLDQRKPGRSRFTSQRREPDAVRIVSGVFDGMTTGAPVSLVIDNVDVRSKDYSNLTERFRPGHADYTYQAKYGLRDHRGGGRASARETAVRVAAGALARQIILPITVRGALVQLGGHAIDENKWDWDEVTKNPFHCPDVASVPRWEEAVDALRRAGSSTGALAYVEADNVPVGLGEPIYHRLDADLAAAMMSIPAVKGVEVGAGFRAVAMQGEEHNDGMRSDKGKVSFTSNNAGGILGGISSGQPITMRCAIKPTSSIRTPTPTITKQGENTSVSTTGRHDPCVGIRSVPVMEAMMALVLCDHLLLHRARYQLNKKG
ncbi:MAG: chorismate synthase [Alphaproteobacteria bacterium GM202ARS2]|nr:chorismate synthase [Alphaproteobacteria bacterium GM202ARS2]